MAIWIALAFWPARVAGRKGHSFIGYFIFSLFFFPLALLVAYMVGDRTPAERARSAIPTHSHPRAVDIYECSRVPHVVVRDVRVFCKRSKGDDERKRA